MLPDRVSNPRPLALESDALPTSVRGPAVCAYVCVCVGGGGRTYTVKSPVGNSTLKKNHSHFFRRQKLLHVRGKASIPFESLSRRLYLPTRIRKFCIAIKLDNIGETAFKICCLPREDAFWLLD